jgi:hypothetical protein
MDVFTYALLMPWKVPLAGILRGLLQFSRPPHRLDRECQNTGAPFNMG